jgi:hypothetical protein
MSLSSIRFGNVYKLSVPARLAAQFQESDSKIKSEVVFHAHTTARMITIAGLGERIRGPIFAAIASTEQIDMKALAEVDANPRLKRTPPFFSPSLQMIIYTGEDIKQKKDHIPANAIDISKPVKALLLTSQPKPKRWVWPFTGN